MIEQKRLQVIKKFLQLSSKKSEELFDIEKELTRLRDLHLQKEIELGKLERGLYRFHHKNKNEVCNVL